MQALLQLAESDLRVLASALRGGRLGSPFSALGVQRVIGSVVAPGLAADLQVLCNAGTTAGGLAAALELLAESRAQRPLLEDIVQVVATSPRCNGGLQRETAVVVEELFRSAVQSVVIAGYSVSQGRRVFAALAERMSAEPALVARFYLDVTRKPGDTSAASEIRKRFIHRFRTNQWPAGSRLPEVYYDPRSLACEPYQTFALHAKCVVVDEWQVFVSSANFTEAAQERNIELGLLLCSPSIAARISGFFDCLVKAHVLERLI
jgi:phosphatidylserine/phosphatidylglycerophosphate/cardiolipin synthase-like enzyme